MDCLDSEIYVERLLNIEMHFVLWKIGLFYSVEVLILSLRWSQGQVSLYFLRQ